MMAIITMIVILIVKDCLTKLTLQKDYLRPSNCKEKTEHLGKIKYRVFYKHTWTSHIVCTTRFSRLRKCYLSRKSFRSMLFCSFICINIFVFLTKPLLQTPGVFLTSTSIAEFSPHPSEFNFRLSPNSHLVENIL